MNGAAAMEPLPMMWHVVFAQGAGFSPVARGSIT
jgi:hypothetical protein